MNQNLPPQGQTPFHQSLPQNCERCCGTVFWLEPGRSGQRCEPHRPIPAAGFDARANAGPDRTDQGQGQPRQNPRRPQGFRAKNLLTRLLLGPTPIKSIFFCHSLPASRLPENRTYRNFNFKPGFQPARRTVTSGLVCFRSRFCPAGTVRTDRRFSHV